MQSFLEVLKTFKLAPFVHHLHQSSLGLEWVVTCELRYQEKVSRCCTLFFSSPFTFYDAVHFWRLCKSWSLFDWSFSRLHRPWSWLRSRLILLGFRELNKLQFPIMFLPFCPTFSCHIWPLISTSRKSLCPIRPKKVFLVRWDLFDLF